jgi:hypothetical protein
MYININNNNIIITTDIDISSSSSVVTDIAIVTSGIGSSITTVVATGGSALLLDLSSERCFDVLLDLGTFHIFSVVVSLVVSGHLSTKPVQGHVLLQAHVSRQSRLGHVASLDDPELGSDRRGDRYA